MLSDIYCDRRRILKHITEIRDHAVRISLRRVIIHCLEILFDLCADIQPVA